MLGGREAVRLRAASRCSASRSKIDCDTKTRASNTLNGPTTRGNAGPSGKPNASRLVFRRVSVTEPADVRQQLAQRRPASPLAAAVSCSASTRRGCARARAIAWITIVRVIGSAVAVPVGTPPANGLVRGNCGPGSGMRRLRRRRTAARSRRARTSDERWMASRTVCGSLLNSSRTSSSAYYELFK